MPADHGPDKEAAPAQQLSSVERAPLPSQTATPAPPPEVKVTIRRDATPPADKRQTAQTQAQADAAPAKPAPQADPAPDPAPKRAAAPQPPAAPKAETLERTIATTADSVPTPTPKSPKLAPARDVRIARTTPAPPSGTDEHAASAMTEPKPTAHPRDAATQPTPAKQPVAHKPATHKPAAAKPAPTDVNAVGEIVRSVQQALAARGYEPGAANGRAGHQTQLAIRKFQADRGLEPTGTIDYALLESLNIVGPRLHAFRPPPGATAGR